MNKNHANNLMLEDSTLPINECLPELIAVLAQKHEAVLQAPPGAGKTTQVPLALLKQTWLAGTDKIIMLEPRRVAAINAATRMASLLGEPLGQTVGYRVRGNSCTSHNTRIEVITEGLLTRWLLDDPELTGVGIVIFDEFHERSLNSDTGLALCLQARELFREAPLKLLVMSATLHSENLCNLLGAQLVASQGRSFPVTVHHAARPAAAARRNQQTPYGQALTDTVCQTIIHALANHDGNVLVFLPGVGEISRALDTLTNTLDENTLCLPLHGSLSLQEQQHAIAPPANKKIRKVVLATDIAETSLTIEGVNIVVDAGLARAPQFDPKTGLTRLHTQNISQASAEQRAGRAGRLAPGFCYRLCTEAEHLARQAFTLPEIVQADLMPLALTLLHWGVDSPDELTWLDPPNTAHWQQALDALTQLGAIDENKQLTTIGTAMCQLACHPRLARMLVESYRRNHVKAGCLLAASLSERMPRHAPSHLERWIEQLQTRTHNDSGLKRLKNLAASFENALKKLASNTQFNLNADSGALDARRLNAKTTGSQARHSPSMKIDGVTMGEVAIGEIGIGELLAFAYPDRIAKKQREQHAQAFYLLANGRRASLSTSDPLSRFDWLCISEVGGHAGKTDDTIFYAAPLDIKTSPEIAKNSDNVESPLAHLIHHTTLADWDENKQRFIAVEQAKIGQCIIAERPLKNIDNSLRVNALCRLVRKKGLGILNWNDEDKQLQQRIILLNRILNTDAGEPWPDVSNQALLDTLESWLAPFLVEVKNLDGLQKITLTEALLSQIDWTSQQTLAKLAPKTVAIPSGRSASIDYSQNPPILAVKLQEMFGCTQTPSIVEGRIQLSIHLLSPARRPLQVTQDLANFWQSSYHEIKKEMKGRYPKHPWPDDPESAEATSKIKRKKTY